MKDYTLKYGKGSVTFALDEAHVTELYGTRSKDRRYKGRSLRDA